MPEHMMPDEIIPNGEEIVERFGGIRPMAAKLNVPVTTVQGWKKRDAIPAIRRDEIVSAAALHNINLKGLIADTGIANENRSPRGASGIADDPALSMARQPQPQATPAPAPQAASPQPKLRVQASPSNGLFEPVDLRAVKRTARTTSLVTTSVLALLILGVGTFLLGSGPSTGRMDALEGRVKVVEQRSSDASVFDTGLLRKSVGDLQQQVGDITNVLGASGDTLSALARTVSAGGGATLTQRLGMIEQQLSGGAGGAVATPLSSMVDRMGTLTQTPQGKAEWQSAIAELRTLVTGLQGRTDTLESALNETKGENTALGRTLSDISGRDLGAAAMLLALTQLRESADRQAPFTGDLELLRQVAQSADPALADSVEKLAPYAESGILSPAALKRELLASANDIVSAKIKGEDVSFKDKIWGRLQSLFSVKKDGMPVAGGDEQALIAKASAQLDASDVAGAMMTLQQLQGPSAAAVQPWQSRASATAIAQQLDGQLVNSLMTKIKSGLSGSGPINMAPQQPVQSVAPQVAPQTQMDTGVMDGQPHLVAPSDTAPAVTPPAPDAIIQQ